VIITHHHDQTDTNTTIMSKVPEWIDLDGRGSPAHAVATAQMTIARLS